MTADGAGYWLVASDGGVFAFGDAQFFGSMGGTPVEQVPSSAWRPTPNGDGYYEVASDGGIFAFPTQGGPSFEGSIGGTPLNDRSWAWRSNAAGQYYLVASDGGVFAFPAANGAPFYGSAGSLGLAQPRYRHGRGQRWLLPGRVRWRRLRLPDGQRTAFPRFDGWTTAGQTHRRHFQLRALQDFRPRPEHSVAPAPPLRRPPQGVEPSATS